MGGGVQSLKDTPAPTLSIQIRKTKRRLTVVPSLTFPNETTVRFYSATGAFKTTRAHSGLHCYSRLLGRP